MKVHVYLNFNGNCAQAFEHYKQVFGCDIACKMTWADNPEMDKSTLSEEKAKQIMHTVINLTDNFELMGCDMPPEGTPGGDCGLKKFVFGDNITINLEPDSKEHADKLIAALASNGGKITSPMADAFWGCYFGMCQDPFGVNWMLNFPLEGNKDEKKDGN
jgi:PhnB protein